MKFQTVGEIIDFLAQLPPDTKVGQRVYSCGSEFIDVINLTDGKMELLDGLPILVIPNEFN